MNFPFQFDRNFPLMAGENLQKRLKSREIDEFISFSSFFAEKGLLVGHNQEVLDARFVGKGDRFLAVASNVPTVKVYDLDTSSCEFLEGHRDAVIALSRWEKLPHVFASCSKVCVDS